MTTRRTKMDNIYDPRIRLMERKLSDLIAENKVLKEMIHNLSPDTKKIVDNSIESAIKKDKRNRKGLHIAYEVSP